MSCLPSKILRKKARLKRGSIPPEQSAIIEMDKQISDKQEEINHLESQTGSSLWLSDLNEFLEAWKKYVDHRISESTSVAKSESSKAKAPTKKRPVVRK